MAKSSAHSGIYLIRGPNERVYIGQSTNLKERLRQHRKQLRNNHHKNQKLQHAWNKYGANEFSFSILLYCEIEDLDLYEQNLLDHYDAVSTGYNIAPKVESTRGIKNPITAERNRSQRGELHPSFGRPRPDLSTRNRQGSPLKGRKIGWRPGLHHRRGKEHPNFGRTSSRRGVETGPTKLMVYRDSISDRLIHGATVSELAREFNVKWETMKRMKNFISERSTAGEIK